MSKYTSHIAINGKPLCRDHKRLVGCPIGVHGNRITCDYADHRKAKEALRHLRSHLIGDNIRIKGGPCPDGGNEVIR